MVLQVRTRGKIVSCGIRGGEKVSGMWFIGTLTDKFAINAYKASLKFALLIGNLGDMIVLSRN